MNDFTISSLFTNYKNGAQRGAWKLMADEMSEEEALSLQRMETLAEP